MCKLILTSGLWFIIASLAVTTATRATWFDSQFCNEKVDGNYVNAQNPHVFYMCSNQITVSQDCPANLVYRKGCNCCDWPSQPDTFCQQKTNGHYAYSDNLFLYYECLNGATTVKYCQDGYIFDKTKNECQLPETTTPQNDDSCKGNKGGNLPNSNNGNSYCVCSCSGDSIQYCADGYMFDASVNKCVEPETTTPEHDFCKGKKDGSHDHPKFSSCYYKCSNGEIDDMCCTYNKGNDRVKCSGKPQKNV